MKPSLRGIPLTSGMTKQSPTSKERGDCFPALRDSSLAMTVSNNPMKTISIQTIAALLMALAMAPCFAQYTGGCGRGDAMAQLLNSPLGSAVVSVYTGGCGRGDAMAQLLNAPLGSAVVSVYTGGCGRGDAMALLLNSPLGAGAVLVIIYGSIISEMGAAIPTVTVALSGDESETVVTGNDGLYSFTVATGGDYTVTPSKSNDSITNNGVTTADIAFIRKQVLTNDFFTSPYKIIAADANNSGTVTTADIAFTRRVVLNNTNTFPITTNPSIIYGRLWEFVNSDQTFSGPPYNPFPFTKVRTYSNISSNQTNQDFIGVKIGDVNGNWNPATP